MAMIREVRLRRFKGFEKFDLRLGHRAVLVGPNNAGKSTAISSIRAVAGMRQRAARDKPTRYEHIRNIGRRGWTVPGGHGMSAENLRYDFLDRTVEIAAIFDNGVRLDAIWPGADDANDDEDTFSDPFFCFGDRSGKGLVTTREIRDQVSEIGNIPIITPVDQRESVKTRETIMRNVSGRLASRHFRNQLLLLDSEESATGTGSRFDDFLGFAEPWLDDIRIDKPGLPSI